MQVASVNLIWLFCLIDAFVTTNGFSAIASPSNTPTGLGIRNAIDPPSATTDVSTTKLEAVTKRQNVVYDGAEFISLTSFLLSEDPSRFTINDNGDDVLPSMRAGMVTVVTGKAENSNERIIGIEKYQNANDGNNADDKDDKLTSMGDNVFVYSDSVATIPNGISDADAISTAAAALCGVHCGMPDLEGSGNAVILGGGDYACFVAKALSELGANVSLVTTRPMALKDTPLNPLKDTDVHTMSPAVGDSGIGFCEAIGEFDTIIDTLADEAMLSKVSSFEEGVNRSTNKGLASKLKTANNCHRYISTLTKSQQFLLKEGLLYARDHVLKYQKKVENDKELLEGTKDKFHYQKLVPPKEFGSKTLQKLLSKKIVYPANRNENGDHIKKQTFVRGCSFPDYGEYEIWPQDSTDGTTIRFGFPSIKELAFEARVDQMLGSATSNNKHHADSVSINHTKQQQSKKKPNKNPYVVDIHTLSDISEEVVFPQKNCILFVSATYCKTCKLLSSGYTRMARQYKEEFKDTDIIFAKADSAGKGGKQITFSLQVESVPTFILFREGKRYGEPFGITRLPSKKLNLAIEYLLSGKDWDSNEFQNDDENKQRTKLQ